MHSAQGLPLSRAPSLCGLQNYTLAVWFVLPLPNSCLALNGIGSPSQTSVWQKSLGVLLKWGPSFSSSGMGPEILFPRIALMMGVPMLLVCRSPCPLVSGKESGNLGTQGTPSCGDAFCKLHNNLWFVLVCTTIFYLVGPHFKWRVRGPSDCTNTFLTLPTPMNSTKVTHAAHCCSGKMQSRCSGKHFYIFISFPW